jgi:protease-4
MDQSSSQPPHQPPSHSPSPPPAHRQGQAVPHVVHIRAKAGGLWSALGLVVGLCLFVAIFIIGIVFGAVGMMAGSTVDTVILEQSYRDGDRTRIVILPVEGVIDERQAEFVRSAVNHVLDDRNVRAVVLRVNSPGGGVTASDEIWYDIERLKQRNIPVIASYGGISASGGYYISCSADHIVAQETCITGSIGVIAQIFTMEGLMDKVGIQPVTLIASGSPEKATGNDIFRQWNEEDQTRIRAMLDASYDVFYRRVSDGRGHIVTDEQQLRALANGSIYTAQEALDGGLIDSIGYLDDAIVQAETIAGLTRGRASVVRLAEPPSLFGGILGAQARTQTRSDLFDADAIRGLVNDLNTPRMMYLMK